MGDRNRAAVVAVIVVAAAGIAWWLMDGEDSRGGTVPAGPTVGEMDCVYGPTVGEMDGLICGHAWIDDGNGARDAGEGPAAGWQVVGGPASSAVDASSGAFTLQVAEGSYTLTVSDAANAAVSCSNSGPHSVTKGSITMVEMPCTP
jgi:hypothetical protein